MSKSRLYIVSDEADIRRFLYFNLANRGFEVRESPGNEQVISQIFDFDPDLIIVDIMTNRIDGFILCGLLCRETKAAVIGFNMRGGQADMIRCFEIGVVDYFNKPLGVEELMSRINAVMRGKRFSGKNKYVRSVS